MANVVCVVCEKGLQTTAKNSVYNSGVWSHKKCPSKVKKMTPEEVKAKRDLTDRIQLLAIKDDRSLNWFMITGQIKKLLDEGYSYEEQMYALNYVYEKDNEEFWGYGRVAKFVEHAREHKKKMEEYENRIQITEQKEEEQSVGLKYKSTNSFIKF